ncbi:MAG: glycosyltransferase family 4 protein [Gemmatimonadota bacterium]|nr:glycosyltransferase family 4 protein [Gemmatimonadota bacterium]
MAARPRVLIVSFIATPGGAHNLWRYLVMDPAVAGQCEFHLLAPRAYRDADPVPFADGTVAFHALTELTPPPLRERLLRRMIGGAVPESTRWTTRLEAIAPDLVLFNLAGMGDLNWCVAPGEGCRVRGVPYWLILQHAHEEFHFENDDRTDAALALVQAARRVLCVSERNRRTLEAALGAALPNVLRAVNGITRATVESGERVMRDAPPRTKGTVRLLCLARFDPAYKGQDLLLEALAAPDWRDRDWVLTLQGGGTHERLLRRLVAQHGFSEDRVRLRAHQRDVSAAFAEADLLVFPSRSEGTPFALVEGLAHGRPAVVTPVGGNDEVVVEGRTGWVASAVTAEALRAALSRAWVARAAWPTAGHAARTHVLAGWTLEAPHRKLLAAILEDGARRQSDP